MAALRLRYHSPPPLYSKPGYNPLLSKSNAKPLLTLSRKTAPRCTKQEQSTPSSRHFVLVHSTCQGGWVWYKLATLLNEAGHRVTAPDLAASGLHLKKLEEVNTFEEYCEPLMEVMEAVPAVERVALVGHGYGGFSVSLAMERFPEKVAVGVFVSASMPTSINSPIAITKEDVTLAAMLMRPGKTFYDSSVARDDFVTAENHGSVNRVYVVCSEGPGIVRERQIWLVEMSPGTELLELDGADRMPMLSKPEELLSLLVDISDRNH